ncbi:hypothetical protein V6N13_082488 [Hibiscus sabdariffa]|uniref:Uncharacterized protein n=2 Tax=Hibiscus sabdariffa TaxID=183260 RepID=A0ABR1ZW50_9ROSI
MASISSMPLSLPSHSAKTTQNSYLPFPSSSLSLSRKPFLSHSSFESNNGKRRKSKLWVTLATPEGVLPSDSIPLDNSQQIVSTTGDEGVATVIQALLFVAFVALTILTIGVIYIAVQDFLGKREREKFEKEESAKNKNKNKNGKKKVRARAGPRGFGQKVDEDEDI